MKRVSTALSSWSSECKVRLTAEEEREEEKGGKGGKEVCGKKGMHKQRGKMRKGS